MTVRLIRPQREGPFWRRARLLIEEYAASLNLDLSFQNFTREMEHLAEEYSPPAGMFLLAERNAVAVGCAGVRRFSESAGELKRLYVIPSARGSGVGRLLAEGIVAAAGELGYGRLLLDTLPAMREAQSLYLSLGFRPVPAYRFNPVPGTVFLGLEIRGNLS